MSERTIQKEIAKDRLAECLQMLEFTTDALLGWSEEALNFTHNHRMGYVTIMYNIREILAKNIAILGDDSNE